MGYTAVTADDVRMTIAEFDRLGRDVFLERYGYREATRFYLVHEGRRYDSKAIVGVAHQVSNGHALKPHEFSGGKNTVVRLLKRLGFEVQPMRNQESDSNVRTF